MKLTDDKLSSLIENEKEWRKIMYVELQGTRQELHDFKVEMATITTTLKVKIGIAGTIFGFLGGSVISLITALIRQ